MLNLCHFAVAVAGVTYPAAVPAPLVFTPVTAPGSHPAFPVLLGFNGPDVRLWRSTDGSSVGLDGGVESHDGVVIVPRFAPAVRWVRAAGLIPFCVPLSGQRQQNGSFVCDVLEPAPEGLEVEFLDPGEWPEDSEDECMDDTPTWQAAGFIKCPTLPLMAYHLHRAIPGSFAVEVADGPDLAQVPVELQTLRLPGGTVQVPPGCEGYDAILVPQDGRIIDAVHVTYPGVAILVTDVTRSGQRTGLFQVR